MGIQGLLPSLTSIQRKRSIKDYCNLTVGVDALCWMHQGAHVMVRDGPPLSFTSSLSHSKLTDYCISKLRLLQMNGVKPILVFDGAKLLMKSRIEHERAQQRQIAREKATQIAATGDWMSAARKYVEGIEISDEMVQALICELRKLKVDYYVAPYEADAQLAYLFKQKKIDLVLTEDSDLLLFGASRCFFKMDMKGNGIEIDLKDLPRSSLFKQPASNQISLIDDKQMLAEYEEMLLYMCMLSGCDYLESIKGVGFKRAVKLVQTHHTNLHAICQDLQNSGLNFDTQKYIQTFKIAHFTFKHQVVFDPQQAETTHLVALNCGRGIASPWVSEMTESEKLYAGSMIEPELAKEICKGYLNPETRDTNQPVGNQDLLLMTQSQPMLLNSQQQVANQASQPQPPINVVVTSTVQQDQKRSSQYCVDTNNHITNQQNSGNSVQLVSENGSNLQPTQQAPLKRVASSIDNQQPNSHQVHCSQAEHPPTAFVRKRETKVQFKLKQGGSQKTQNLHRSDLESPLFLTNPYGQQNSKALNNHMRRRVQSGVTQMQSNRGSPGKATTQKYMKSAAQVTKNNNAQANSNEQSSKGIVSQFNGNGNCSASNYNEVQRQQISSVIEIPSNQFCSPPIQKNKTECQDNGIQQQHPGQKLNQQAGPTMIRSFSVLPTVNKKSYLRTFISPHRTSNSPDKNAVNTRSFTKKSVESQNSVVSQPSPCTKFMKQRPHTESEVKQFEPTNPTNPTLPHQQQQPVATSATIVLKTTPDKYGGKRSATLSSPDRPLKAMPDSVKIMVQQQQLQKKASQIGLKSGEGENLKTRSTTPTIGNNSYSQIVGDSKAGISVVSEKEREKRSISKLQSQQRKSLIVRRTVNANSKIFNFFK